jgi:glycosyltransferase involved in cell wall biosynthesis
MRVLYYTDSLRLGGKERQLVELLKGLRRRSIEVLLVCMDRGEFYEPDVQAIGVPLRYLFRKMRWDPFVALGLYRMVVEFKPHIIHTNSMMSSAYALPVAKFFGVPLINGSIRNCFRYSSLRWKVERAVLSLSDFRIANSVAGLESRGFSPDCEKNFVVHNGFDLSRAEAADNSTATRQKDTRDCAHVGMVAEFRADKDFRTFLLAARRVLSKRDDVVFVTVGDGETLAEMRAMVADLGDKVRFLGRRKDIEHITSTFSVGVLASFTEGISNSIMEYMAMAKPVVVTDCPGSRELVKDGDTGYLVAPQDAVALAEKIEHLLNHPEQAREMGRAGRRLIEQEFSLSGMVDSTIQVYELALRSETSLNESAREGSIEKCTR